MIRCIHEDCKYRGLLGENIDYCNYIGHAKRARRCDPAVCDKYLSKLETGTAAARKSVAESCQSDLFQQRY
ncbi:hypothetical protein FRZ06_10180 [Anoxybacterium hadale]|uniref:Uncharacterized protein n=1 Tax=Anoxybacterium hadale TaxID=3408580 RepID=A0ACD1AB20_9FIRM|nr:hypothetical protein FRZ06_10180 [Clostridiales bacterium]